jgi:hypothetical protein
LIRRAASGQHPKPCAPLVPLLALAALIHASCGKKKVERTSEELAVQVTAALTASPPSITLRWAENPADTKSIDVYRRLPGEPSFGAPIARGLPPSTTSYTDLNVQQSVIYEYYVERSLTAKPWWSAGTLTSAIEAPLVEDRGRLVLVVESGVAEALAAGIAQLEDDLSGDGWTVTRIDVPKSADPPSVKAKIRAIYDAAPKEVKSAFLLGHVPVPYSGNTAPDGHQTPKAGPVHVGAWPADVFYADMRGEWTDVTVDTRKNPDPPADAINENIPGDGKFDQKWVGGVTRTPYEFGPLWLAPTLYGDLALAVGRVDLSDLPTFAPRTEVDLLLQYLDKNHRYRHKLLTAAPRGLITDRVGFRPLGLERLPGSFLPSSAWNGFAAIVGPSGVRVGPWFDTLQKESFLFAYAACPGQQNECEGVLTTRDLEKRDPRAIFTLLYGSYFGDWNHTDNLLRAVLATRSFGLTAGWGNPSWYLHPLGLGETIGAATLLTQRAMPLAFIALMGDPTLRVQVIAPPSGLAAVASPEGGVTLRWKASPEAVLGYHVYRARSRSEPFQRISPALVRKAEFKDPAPKASAEPGRYMVRAVALEVTPSGSYFNASQGVFAAAPPPLAPDPAKGAKPAPEAPSSGALKGASDPAKARPAPHPK